MQPEIKTASDITGAVAREIRQGLKMPQRQFWGGISVSAAAGCAYENGHAPVPGTVQRLLFLHYVLSIPTDMEASDAHFAALVPSIQKIKSTRETAEEAATVISRGLEILNGIR